jgi:hypothetical protein
MFSWQPFDKLRALSWQLKDRRRIADLGLRNAKLGTRPKSGSPKDNFRCGWCALREQKVNLVIA